MKRILRPTVGLLSPDRRGRCRWSGGRRGGGDGLGVQLAGVEQAGEVGEGLGDGAVEHEGHRLGEDLGRVDEQAARSARHGVVDDVHGAEVELHRDGPGDRVLEPTQVVVEGDDVLDQRHAGAQREGAHPVGHPGVDHSGEPLADALGRGEHPPDVVGAALDPGVAAERRHPRSFQSDCNEDPEGIPVADSVSRRAPAPLDPCARPGARHHGRPPLLAPRQAPRPGHAPPPAVRAVPVDGGGQLDRLPARRLRERPRRAASAATACSAPTSPSPWACPPRCTPPTATR